MVAIKVYITKEIKNALDDVVKRSNIKSRSELVRSIFALYLFGRNQGNFSETHFSPPPPSNIIKKPDKKEGLIGYGKHHKEILSQLLPILEERRKRMERRRKNGSCSVHGRG